ncbi:glycosyltransferase family 8 protein [Schizophyllum commune H4-8]|uniref:glycosyltransferase family 8 protein n=1 Tax=Schizophyllum commune (strain H4-8 / FGSC 9210) TaxID=578458 RepID=UPI00215FD0D8|nr:glycosyltransferase family 8 protein [Schizophyllum commune H4-8]KAI5897796.1 glycosyltransferase family 8 protein [Schizophyllum commune H4-8]
MAAPNAFVTLVTSDRYLPGALAQVAAIADLHPKEAHEPHEHFQTVCLVTPETVDVSTIKALRGAFNVVVGVEIIEQEDDKGLRLLVEPLSLEMPLGRPDLNTVLTKLHIFRLTQYEKIIFLDADVLPVRPLSHLFALPHEFSAVPDVGWPDIFNSGVLVFSPGEDKFNELRELLKSKGSWDGGDQGLLNEWRGENWNRLSFTYNTTPTAAYTYAPAYERYGSQISAIHFIGPHKPWNNLAYRHPFVGRQPDTDPGLKRAYDYDALVDRWYAVYDRHYRAETPATTSQFEVRKYVASWDAQAGTGDKDLASTPAVKAGGALGLDQLRRLAIEGLNAAGVPPPEGPRQGGEYRSMPLDGRIDLMRPPPQPSDSTSSPIKHAIELAQQPGHPSYPGPPSRSSPGGTPTQTSPTPAPSEVPSSPRLSTVSLPKVTPGPSRQGSYSSNIFAPPTQQYEPGHSLLFDNAPSQSSQQGQPSSQPEDQAPGQHQLQQPYFVEPPTDPIQRYQHEFRQYEQQRKEYQYEQAHPDEVYHERSHDGQHTPHDQTQGHHEQARHEHRDHGAGHDQQQQQHHQHPVGHQSSSAPQPQQWQGQDMQQHERRRSSEPPRPPSPPKLLWNPAREPPPNVPPTANAFPTDTYFPNAWDSAPQPPHILNKTPSPGAPAAAAAVSPPADSRGLFSPPPPPEIPVELQLQGHYRRVTGEDEHPDRHKVKPVFPWEEKPRAKPGRVFPHGESPSPSEFKIPLPEVEPEPEAQQPAPGVPAVQTTSPTRVWDTPSRASDSDRTPRASPPVHGLPRTLAFANAWDTVPSIQKYADKLRPPPPVARARPVSPFDEQGWRRKLEERSDMSAVDGDDEEDSEDDDVQPRPRAYSSDHGSRSSSSRRSRSASSVSSSHSFQSKRKQYRSFGVQTDTVETKTVAVQVAVVAPPPVLQEKKAQRARGPALLPAASVSDAGGLGLSPMNGQTERRTSPLVSPREFAYPTTNASKRAMKPAQTSPPVRPAVGSSTTPPRRQSPVTQTSPPTSRTVSRIKTTSPPASVGSTPTASASMSRQVSNESNITSPPSSIGPVSPPEGHPIGAPTAKKAARVFDPARGVDLFKRGSEEVLARFLRMGSWEDEANAASPR